MKVIFMILVVLTVLPSKVKFILDIVFEQVSYTAVLFMDQYR